MNNQSSTQAPPKNNTGLTEPTLLTGSSRSKRKKSQIRRENKALGIGSESDQEEELGKVVKLGEHHYERVMTRSQKKKAYACQSGFKLNQESSRLVGMPSPLNNFELRASGASEAPV